MNEIEMDLEQIAKEMRVIKQFLVLLTIFGAGVPEPVRAAVERIARCITRAQSFSRGRDLEPRRPLKGGPITPTLRLGLAALLRREAHFPAP